MWTAERAFGVMVEGMQCEKEDKATGEKSIKEEGVGVGRDAAALGFVHRPAATF